MAFRGPQVWFWRWRRNPLRRRVDVVEAWVVLGAWALTVLAGVLAGLAAARSVDSGLARDRATWHQAVARVVSRVPGKSAGQKPKPDGERVWTQVRWTVADGSAHTGQVRVAPGSPAGTPVRVWTDPRGHLVTRPATAAEATFRAGLLGTLVGTAAGAVPFICGRVVRTSLERRRLAHWDAEWARLGPRWGHTTG
ncbi:hypothetical protein ACIQMP_07200 [Streptomyces sp. NPDC091385]|uniref:Rv1733c family protein n=1 Tax=Streptomyces sp. NPDC091385 TaxID=3365997 RepID=UPI00381523C2